MSLISRTYTFTDGTVAYGSQVDSEIQNIVNTINSLDAATTTWDNVKVTTLLPQADVNMNSHKLTSVGTPSSAGDAVNLSYLQGNYTTTTGMAGTRILQIVQAVGGAQVNSSSSAYSSTNITAAITPASNQSKIKISFYSTASSASTGFLVYSLFRGAVDLGDSVGGFGSLDGGAATKGIISGVYIDSPATSLSTTYTVKIKNTGSSSVSVPAGAGPSSNQNYGNPTIILEEIG